MQSPAFFNLDAVKAQVEETIGLLCIVLFAMFMIVGNVSVPDVQFVQTDFLADL
jgi:hypothetical protein